MSKYSAEALQRATNNASAANYGAIYAGFVAKGIAGADIMPRENVFTFDAWKALGRSVKKGEHGVKIVTWIDCKGRAERDPVTGEEERRGFRRPKTTTVFHISQTELTAAAKARWAAAKAARQQVSPAELDAHHEAEHAPAPASAPADRWLEQAV